MYRRIALCSIVCSSIFFASQDDVAALFKGSCMPQECAVVIRLADTSVDTLKNIDQEHLSVLLNYLYIAGRSSKIERSVAEQLAKLQRMLIDIEINGSDYEQAASLLAHLANLLPIKDRHAQSLHVIEQYIDEHVDYQPLFSQIIEQLQHLLMQVYEHRATALDQLLEMSAKQFDLNPFTAHRGLYRMLAQEPDLLIAGPITALSKMDCLSGTMGSLTHVIGAALQVKDNLAAATYLSLELSYLYFKELYVRLHKQYRMRYGVEPQLLFAQSGLLSIDERIALPDTLGV